MEKIPKTPDIETPNTVEADDDFNYRIIRGHYRKDGKPVNSAQVHMEYITRTDYLIQAMVDGVSVQDPETGNYQVEKPEVVIFLDKSGRPLQWLVDGLWDKLAPKAGSSEIPKKPKFKFLNIDREQWADIIDPEGVGATGVDSLGPDIIKSLRSVFVEPKYKRDKDGDVEVRPLDNIEQAPSELDHKTILVIDEVKTSGRTLDYAKSMIKAAFPTAKVAGMYWMTEMATLPNGNMTNRDLPAWYDDKTVYGRGVGNRSESSAQSVSLTQRLGKLFLSTRFLQGDPMGAQVRREIEHLTTRPDVPIAPSTSRDDYREKLAELNGGDEAAALAKIHSIGRIVT